MPEVKLPPVAVEEAVIPAEIPWGVQHINAPKAWDITTGEDIVVAILDTGIDSTHPDLAGKVITGRNFTSDYAGNIANFQDNQGHGTHVAGTIGAIADGHGVVGVAPNVKYIIGKVLSGSGAGSYDAIINGITWATQWQGPNKEKVRIISMSLGGAQDVPQLHQAIIAAVNAGIVVVCAAGNSGDGNSNTNEYDYPGAYDEVIEVGAIDSLDQIANFSNTNPEVDIVAPGVDIISTVPGGKYAKMSGTSMATPHVAGFLALLINALEKVNGKKLSVTDARAALYEYVRPLDKYNVNAVGKGVIDFGVKDIPNVSQPIAPVPAPVQPAPQPEPVKPAPVEPAPQPTPEPAPVPEPKPAEPIPTPTPAPSEPSDKIGANVVEQEGKFFIEVGPFGSRKDAESVLINKVLA